MAEWCPWALETISSTSQRSCHRTTVFGGSARRPRGAQTNPRRSWRRTSSPRATTCPLMSCLRSMATRRQTPFQTGRVRVVTWPRTSQT
ncbi:MIER2 isoform 1 [Pongo abelii]|uniref:MIER2 isoform 1 n=1 Tax=Pongo abelii TaxID=9601 RepID=A0A2J8R0T3_PONAB|nr:MIER2 isoform 1 [Pongo abelii]